MEKFQDRVQPWLIKCFGPDIAYDSIERNHRFLEESMELVQACGCTRDEAHQLVDYTFSRPMGEKSQEVGGVMITLAALCLAHGLDMHGAGETELQRIWTMVSVIRAKQAGKPKFSPLPGPTPMDSAFNSEVDKQIAIVDAMRHQRLERRLQNVPVENERRQGFDRRARSDPLKD